MLKNISLSYLACQVGGWGLLMGPFCFKFPHLAGKMSVVVIVGVLVSHCLREVIMRHRWMEGSLRRGLSRILLAMVIASVVGVVIRWTVMRILFDEEYLYLRLVPTVLDVGLLMSSWTGIYCLFQYRTVVRRIDARGKMLGRRVDEMQRREVESMDAEAIVDRLKKIEGMIDVDAAGARAAITEFSKLLREGVLKVD